MERTYFLFNILYVDDDFVLSSIKRDSECHKNNKPERYDKRKHSINYTNTNALPETHDI